MRLYAKLPLIWSTHDVYLCQMLISCIKASFCFETRLFLSEVMVGFYFEPNIYIYGMWRIEYNLYEYNPLEQHDFSTCKQSISLFLSFSLCPVLLGSCASTNRTLNVVLAVQTAGLGRSLYSASCYLLSLSLLSTLLSSWLCCPSEALDAILADSAPSRYKYCFQTKTILKRI